MRPQPGLDHVRAATAWQQWNVPVRFTSRTRFHVVEVDLEERAEAARGRRCSRGSSARRARSRTCGDAGVDAGPVGDVGRRRRRAVPPAAAILAAAAVGRRRRRGRSMATASAVGGQPLADGEADARPAAGDDRDRRGSRHWIGSSPAKVVRCMSRGERRVVGAGPVQHAAVVPDHDVADLPLVAVDAVGRGGPVEEVVEQRPALVAVHARRRGRWWRRARATCGPSGASTRAGAPSAGAAARSPPPRRTGRGCAAAATPRSCARPGPTRAAPSRRR